MSRTLWRSNVLINLVLCLVLCGKGQAQTLVINELMASNDSTIQDPEGQNEDWVEIYNGGSEVLDLAGFFLTDDSSRPTKWQFPGGPHGLWIDSNGDVYVAQVGEPNGLNKYARI